MWCGTYHSVAGKQQNCGVVLEKEENIYTLVCKCEVSGFHFTHTHTHRHTYTLTPPPPPPPHPTHTQAITQMGRMQAPIFIIIFTKSKQIIYITQRRFLPPKCCFQYLARLLSLLSWGRIVKFKNSSNDITLLLAFKTTECFSSGAVRWCLQLIHVARSLHCIQV